MNDECTGIICKVWPGGCPHPEICQDECIDDDINREREYIDKGIAMTFEEEMVNDITQLLDDVVPKIISRLMNSRKIAERIAKISKKYVDAKLKNI